MRHTGGHLKDKEWKAGETCISHNSAEKPKQGQQVTNEQVQKTRSVGREERSVIKTFSSTELLSGRESGEEGINVRWSFPETIEHTHELSH